LTGADGWKVSGRDGTKKALIDQVVQDAMRDRRTIPFRAGDH